MVTKQRYEMYTQFDHETDQRNWFMTIRSYSPVRDVLAEGLDRLCGATGHRIELLSRAVFNWAWGIERELVRLPMTEDDAFKVDPKWVTTVKRYDREAEEEEEDDDD